MTLDPATSAKISAYRPRNAAPEWEAVADLVRALVTGSVQMAGYNVGRLLHVTARLAVWAERSGLPRDPDLWLRHETIDAFILNCPDLKPATILTYRTWLRRMRAALAWMERGETIPPPIRAPKTVTAPYTAQELAGLRTWAGHLPGQARSDALALLTLGRGCGLGPGELATIRGPDIRTVSSGAVVVGTPGLDRLIVAGAAYERDLAGLARDRGERFLFRPGRITPDAKNLVNSWCSKHRPIGGLPALSARRLRSTWIVELLTRRIDTAVVADAAGLASPSALAPYQQFVPSLDEQTAMALLRGVR